MGEYSNITSLWLEIWAKFWAWIDLGGQLWVDLGGVVEVVEEAREVPTFLWSFATSLHFI